MLLLEIKNIIGDHNFSVEKWSDEIVIKIWESEEIITVNRQGKVRYETGEGDNYLDSQMLQEIQDVIVKLEQYSGYLVSIIEE